MRIILITPAPAKSKAGNRATAIRWAYLLRSLGHRVDIALSYSGQKVDLMIALHAWRSADAVKRYVDSKGHKSLIVALTGTDAYQFIHSHREATLQSIYLADQLVGLHALIALTLPQDQQYKMNVIYQSALPIGARKPYIRYFHVSVLGHLRVEKDSMRPAMAVRNLPAHSRIQVHHYGKALTPVWHDTAVAEMHNNPRYNWHGEIAQHKIRQLYQRTHLLVLPSRMEGGANVLSEAIVAGVPVIASYIEGSIGLLGKDYPGYYPLENEHLLSKALLRAEADASFYQALQSACDDRRAWFTPERERNAWQLLLNKL